MSMKRVRAAQADMMKKAVTRYRLMIPDGFDGRTSRSLLHRGWVANTGCSYPDGGEVYAVTLLGFRWLLDYMTDNATTIGAIEELATTSAVFVREYKSMEKYLLKTLPGRGA